MWKNQGVLFAIVLLCCLGGITIAYRNNYLPEKVKKVVDRACGIEETVVSDKGIEWNRSEKGHPAGVNLTELQRQREEEWARQEAVIDQWMEHMTIGQKLAQCMILTNEKDMTGYNFRTRQPGGVIFFAVDFDGKTIREVRERVDSMQATADVPLLIGVDEEGGDISRICGLREEDVPQFESARVIYQQGIEAVRTESKRKADILQQLGININFDPVADVVNDPAAYMYERSASGKAEEVAEYVKTVVTEMDAVNMGVCLKHFPGYGNNVNTHTTFATDPKSLKAYRQNDFLPYQTGIAAGAGMVMVSHITMQAVDEENPASLSQKVHALLREEFQYDGVIIADDLNMQAILKKYSMEEATGRAFVAGNDMIFSADFEASMKGAYQALHDGTISEQQIDESVRRILRYKYTLTDEETGKNE